ncbi:Inherit from COG: epimerase dehydratase [Seminavis robusta]|uniref:Inherit from COG: epimerase dehydratase n=1 Tax=Seminavis robusta TaxID=568900 RepID=A0A9N8DNS5_9STRA|nr:Inherit from COG: epimerase dehydratase [Seminavis robusta]|eukprot:Sro157_g071320.1 Inherit from COG: epimerase dehydratase (302) ;mRNA; f:84526-85431
MLRHKRTISLAATAQLLWIVLITVTVTLPPCHAHTAILFGASGTVGSEVLRALLANPSFWNEIILVGRRFPTLEDSSTRITKVQVSDLATVDQNKDLLQLEHVDACFNAVGAGYPQKLSLSDWYTVDVGIAASVARLCQQIPGVSYISLLSAVTAETNPKPYTAEEMERYNPKKPMGWWGLLMQYDRIKGLAEQAVMSTTTSFNGHISLFQPSTIVTETERYGWLDWTLFRVHPLVDPWLPPRYRSVKVQLLGMAMAMDAQTYVQDSDDSSSKFTRSIRTMSKLSYLGYIYIVEEEPETVE